jgi:drug/metabolite transporter (DMT)-like permease
LLFALMGVIWGIPYLMIKVAVEGVSVPFLVFSRCAIGALLLLPLALRASGGMARLRRHAVPILAFAAFEIIGPWALLSDAERELSSSMTGLLIAAVPVIGAVLARLVGDDRLSTMRWFGLAIGLGGVALLAAPQLRGGSGWSVTEVLLTALGYAIAPMIVARRLREVPTLQLTAACLTVGALVYAGPALVSRPAEMPEPKVLASIGGLGAICTALGFILFFELIREVGTARAMVFTYVNPAVAVLAGVLVLDEALTLTIGGAFVLILGGSLLATGGFARNRPPAPPDPGQPAEPPGAQSASLSSA